MGVAKAMAQQRRRERQCRTRRVLHLHPTRWSGQQAGQTVNLRESLGASGILTHDARVIHKVIHHTVLALYVNTMQGLGEGAVVRERKALQRLTKKATGTGCVYWL